MDVAIEQVGSASVVRISGSVDGLTADALQTALQEQIETGGARLVGDLSGVEYTSSAGLRALLGCRGRSSGRRLGSTWVLGRRQRGDDRR